MFGADARIIESGRDRMTFIDLAIGVHQQVGAVSMEDAGPSSSQRRSMAVFDVEPMAGGFDAIEFDLAVVEKRMEQADGVGAAADAGDKRIRQPSLHRRHLRA